MRPDPVPAPTTVRARRADLLVAAALSVLLSLCWTLHDWNSIRWLVLPDNDDMMRLQQVRDWLAGQAFNDWTQYKLAPPEGGPMHWSRLNDIGPAAIILAARPLLGGHGAELLAVLLYPALLFAGFLYLCARIARRLHGAQGAIPAAIIAACAYPAHTLFLPGRIDHHALQLVLTFTALLALVARPALATGLVAGAAVALSLAVGLETAPAAAALMAALLGLWAWRGEAERARLLGMGAGLIAVTLPLLLWARPTFWSTQWCDGFTPASTTATLVLGGYWLALAAASPRLTGPWARLLAGAGLGGAAGAALLAAYPGCVSGPYGPMDPFVRQAFMENVLEATGVWSRRTIGFGLPNAGLMIVATLFAGWLMATRRLRWDRWGPVLAVLLISDAVLLVQTRGAYLGSAAAAPVLAGLVLAARRVERGRALALAGAWIASAGILHLLIPSRLDAALTPGLAAPTTVFKACKAGDTWHQLDRFPAGTMMAAMDMGAYVIGGSHHASVAAGYHRSNRGNRAMYDFFLSPPARARAIGAQWSTDYVVLCPTDFEELGVRFVYPHSLAARLHAGQVPAWLEPLPLRDTGLQLYRVRR